MVMKDKLYKNYHKGSFYRNRRIMFTAAVLFTGTFAVAVPTYISSITRNTVKAEVRENTNVARLVDKIENVEIEEFVSFETKVK